MTWEPTHVQFTVIRARNLVGKLKGKSSAKVTDVFVTISLGKEKFQTSTVKYGGKVQNGVEWFEECDLAIPSMDSGVEVHVMNRGLLSDEFIGYMSVPLHEHSVYDRPKSHWLQLKHKPSKMPDGRYRGEVEVRLTFHVKSREETSPGSLKGKRAGSIKSLVSGLGDKFKFHRRSLRGEGNQQFSTPQPGRSHKQQKASTKTAPYSGSIEPSTNSSINFDAVDLYVPEQCWRENDYDNDSLGDGNFARSYSLTSDKRRDVRDFKSRSLMNLPSEHSLTLPNPRRNRQRPSLDDSALRVPTSQRSSRSSRSSVTSQDGYLENIFKKECEVDDRMNDMYNESIVEEYEDEYDVPTRKSAVFYEEETNIDASHSSSESSETGSTETVSDSDEQITLPKVKLKENGAIHSGNGAIHSDLGGIGVVNGDTIGDTAADVLTGGEAPPEYSASEYHSAGSQVEVSTVGQSDDDKVEQDPDECTSELDRVIARENSRRKMTDMLNSHGSSDNVASSASSLSYQGRTAAERAFDRGSTDSNPDARRKIAPQTDFSFTGVSPTYTDDSNANQRKRTKQYAKGGRRYTVQGLEQMPTHQSAPNIYDQRPVFTREDSIPEDLMNVYRNMNRDELVRLVVMHKAQLIRKDQYIKDLEGYIDQLLVRVMETSPRILQNL